MTNRNKTELFREFVRSLLTYQTPIQIPTPESSEDSSSGES
ncbi:hypothetical protein [Moorena sp. SIO1G6]|nr:hypothetical protein [Moorena sp. SIO1G6]